MHTARAQRGHSAHMKLGVFATIGNILAYTNHTTPTTLHSLMFPYLALARTGEGVSDLPSRTPGRAALVVAEFLWLAPGVSPRRKREADVILRLHFMPVHGTDYEKKTEKLPKYGSADNN